MGKVGSAGHDPPRYRTLYQGFHCCPHHHLRLDSDASSGNVRLVVNIAKRVGNKLSAFESGRERGKIRRRGAVSRENSGFLQGNDFGDAFA